MKKYKLYHSEAGYKCKVNYNELKFLFNVADDLSVAALNDFIKSTGYYIMEL